MGNLRDTRFTRALCGACGAEVYTGMTDGLMVRLDVEPVDLDSEARALLTGRQTYSRVMSWMVWRGGIERFIREGTRPWLGSEAVHAEHPCRARTIPLPPSPSTPAPGPGEVPPF